MLLEQLVAKAAQPQQYNWEEYYRWYYSTLAGREATDFTFWQCTKCLAVNLLFLPARYGTCRSCGLTHLPTA